MAYPPLIILVVTLHYLFIAAAIFGGVAVLRRPWLAFIHIPIFVWAVLIAFTPLGCPLTILEKSLRIRAGWVVYSGGFLSRYVDPGLATLGLGALVRYFGYLVLGLNVVLYGMLIARHMSKPVRTNGAID